MRPVYALGNDQRLELLMQLDLATVLVLHPSSLVMGAICFLYLKWRAPHHLGLGKMAMAFLLLAAGSVLAGAGERNSIPHGVWTYVSFVLGLFAYTLFWIGLGNLVQEKPAGRWWWWLALPVTLAIIAGITNFHTVNIYRGCVFLSVMAGSTLAGAWLVMADPLREKLTSRYALAAVLLVKALLGLLTIASLALPDVIALAPAVLFTFLILCQFTIAMFVLLLVQERVERRLILLSETDALTKIHNRRWFYGRMPAHVRSGDAFLAIDIDHFKSVNDRHGHAVGDIVLAAAAQKMAEKVPDNALFARMGGEEFGLFIPATAGLPPVLVGECVRSAVEMLAIDHDGGTLPVTVSIGVSQSVAGGPAASLIRAADEALYAAKRTGRNRVVRSDPVAPSSGPLEANCASEPDGNSHRAA
jgi:diguanylate cyclase (GGDEF)-like protein